MSKEIYISSTPHETRLAIVEKEELTEIYYERENEYTLAGSIYNGRVTRVLPGMQSSFVDIGLERDAFLYITDFMEEAGDAADFDGAAGGERAPRGDRPRGEGRGDGRGERGGRGRRDGRDRDRDRGGERSGREVAPEARSEGSSFEEPGSYAPVEDEALDAAPLSDEGEEIGEGAPGADGGRRWRGRRGRRRGRGVAGEGSAETPAGNETDESGVEAAAPREIAPREIAPREEVRAAERRPESRDGGDRGERGGRERGGRDRGGRDRGGRDRGGREASGGREAVGRDSRLDSVRERFAPRGARPGGADDEVVNLNASAGPAVEPFILPGESLSKYRRGENGAAESAARQASSASSTIVAKPSTEVAPLVGWDGGAVLPGETLRAREPRGGETRGGDSRGEDRGGREERGGRGRDRRRGRDEQRGRGRDGQRESAPRTEYRAEPTVIDPAEAVLPAVSSGHDVAESEYEPQYVGQTDLAPVEAVETAAQHEAEFEEAIASVHDAELREAEELPEAVEPEPEFHETTAEYEPEENASASFRVDPAGAREFRQSGVEEPVVEAVHDVGHEPEFTSLQPTGELISEVAHAETLHADPTSPIEHEAVVQSVFAAEAETPVSIEGERAHHAQELEQGFAPGDGQLEEELLDEEDAEIGSLHAGAFDDDVEEETLEGAADLGSMIRDMTIDDITRPEPVEVDEDEDDDEDVEFDDEEDFEEDELASNGEEDFVEEEVSGSQISEAEEEEYAEASSFDENGEARAVAVEGEPAVREGEREGGREGGRRGRRDGRRGGRDRERSGGGERSGGDRGSDRGGRDRRGMAGSRSGGRDRGRQSMQSTNLPAISDLLKPGQEVLVQIAKEPIAKKGARITSHIALPGRFLVFMPTVNHTGVSRKIESDSERRRLKEILLSEKGDATGGFIVRTAAAGASEEELRSDLRFLLNLWADIKARSESIEEPGADLSRFEFD